MFAGATLTLELTLGPTLGLLLQGTALAQATLSERKDGPLPTPQIEASEPVVPEPVVLEPVVLEPVVPAPDEGRLVLDILAPPQAKLDPGDEIAYEACLSEQDAARLRGEILVCRRRQDGSEVSGYDKKKWEQDYAQRTQGMKTPDVAGAGGSVLTPGEGSLITITVTQKGCFLGPCAPEQALIIDVGALPEAPEGSDADRIARGLPALGKE